MFNKANWPPSCTNHTAGFSGQKGGTQIPKQLIVKVKSVSCSDHVDGSASCCMMRLRGHQCGGIGMNYLTHTVHMHTHKCTCTQHYFSAYVQCLKPATCLLLHRNRVTHWLQFSVPTYTCNCVSMFISLWCMDNKISWLRGWASGVYHKGIALLGYYAVLIGNRLARFWDNLLVPSSSVKQSWPWIWDQYAVPICW